MRRGAVILCGGDSTRMGYSKAMLPFGDELMLQRVVRLVSEVVAQKNIVVVASAQQVLPSLPRPVVIARDRMEGLGPLQGLFIGIAALVDKTDAIFACACDVPRLVPAFIDRLFQLLDTFEIVVPLEGEHYHPLAAVYSPTLSEQAQRSLESNQLRLSSFIRRCNAMEIRVEELRDVDSNLSSLDNVNCPTEYFAAMHELGFDVPEEISKLLE